jgi:hypothetical protein
METEMVKRFIGAVLVAVVIALAMERTAYAFYIECFDWGWFSSCWPF